MLNLSPAIQEELTELLRPTFSNPHARLTLLREFLWESPVLGKIDFAIGPTDTFIVAMIQTLCQYGEIKPGLHALAALLDGVMGRVGIETQERLEDIRIQLFPQIESVQTLRVAVIAMTRGEALALDSAAKPHGPWKTLKEELRKHDVSDVTDCYDETSRDEWKPAMTDKQPLREVLEQIVAELNRESDRTEIVTEYLSQDFLSPDSDKRARARDALEKHGGLIIVDALSMCHQGLRKLFNKGASVISCNNNVAMAVLSPLRADTFTINQLLKKKIYTKHLEAPFGYFNNKRLLSYEFGLCDICNLQRWLTFALSQAGSGLNREKREHIYAARGGPAKGDLGKYISGK